MQHQWDFFAFMEKILELDHGEWVLNPIFWFKLILGGAS